MSYKNIEKQHAAWRRARTKYYLKHKGMTQPAQPKPHVIPSVIPSNVIPEPLTPDQAVRLIEGKPINSVPQTRLVLKSLERVNPQFLSKSYQAR